MNKLAFEYYTYKKDVYQALGIVELKHPTTGKWVKAVKYKSTTRIPTPICVRELSDFVNKFVGVTSWDDV